MLESRPGVSDSQRASRSLASSLASSSSSSSWRPGRRASASASGCWLADAMLFPMQAKRCPECSRLERCHCRSAGSAASAQRGLVCRRTEYEHESSVYVRSCVTLRGPSTKHLAERSPALGPSRVPLIWFDLIRFDSIWVDNFFDLIFILIWRARRILLRINFDLIWFDSIWFESIIFLIWFLFWFDVRGVFY